MIKYRVWCWDGLNRKWRYTSIAPDPSEPSEFMMETRNLRKAQKRVIDLISQKNYALLDVIEVE